MLFYLIKRLLLIFPTLFIILLINFIIIQLAPGGPVEQAIFQAENIHSINGNPLSINNTADSKYLGGTGLSPEMIAQIKKQYGFDQPIYKRFILMIKNYMMLDFGESFFKGKSVIDLIIEKLPVSISLGLWTLLLSYLVAIPLGIKKAQQQGLFFDRITSLLLIIAYAIPTFIFAILFIVLFAGGSYWQIFPLQGLISDDFDQLGLWEKIIDYLWHICLPVLSMIISGCASLSYLTKYSFMEELKKQYVLTAYAKGLTKNRVLYGHVFRNAMIVILAGLPEALMAIFFTGNLLIEIIFNLDGLGLLGFEAVVQRDYPVIFTTLFIFTLFGLFMRLISDVLYHYIDPRINFDYRA